MEAGRYDREIPRFPTNRSIEQAQKEVSEKQEQFAALQTECNSLGVENLGRLSECLSEMVKLKDQIIKKQETVNFQFAATMPERPTEAQQITDVIWRSFAETLPGTTRMMNESIETLQFKEASLKEQTDFAHLLSKTEAADPRESPAMLGNLERMARTMPAELQTEFILLQGRLSKASPPPDAEDEFAEDLFAEEEESKLRSGGAGGGGAGLIGKKRDRTELIEILNANYKIQDVPSHGDCFFECTAKVLGKTHQHWRKKIANHLKEHRKDYQEIVMLTLHMDEVFKERYDSFLSTIAFEKCLGKVVAAGDDFSQFPEIGKQALKKELGQEADDYDVYCKYISTKSLPDKDTGTWGGPVEMKVLSDMIKAPVLTITGEEGNFQIAGEIVGEEHPGEPLIFHLSESHFGVGVPK
jgi:hypothetical protein